MVRPADQLSHAFADAAMHITVLAGTTLLNYELGVTLR